MTNAMEKRKMDLIQIERTKLNYLLQDQAQEQKEFDAAQMNKKIQEHEAREAKKLKEFMEQKRLDAIQAKKEANETRTLVNQARSSGANENVVNLLSNFQGK